MSETNVVDPQGQTLTVAGTQATLAPEVPVPSKPRKICIVGFASARDQAPYADASWEMWGCNDVYAYVPRIDVTFELHDLANLQEAGRRNPKHLETIANGVRPSVVLGSVKAANPNFKNCVAYPKEAIDQSFGRNYFTSSIALMLALAIAEMTEIVTFPDGRQFRLARPGCELAMFGVDMAADSEFYAQRPCVEYYVGLADACGLPTFIAPTSDICKSAGTYGFDTTLPLRQKIEGKIVETMKASQQADQNLLNLQLQKEQVLYQKGTADGARGAYKHLRNTWTNPHEVVKPALEGLDRHGELMPNLNPTPEQPTDNAGGR